MFTLLFLKKMLSSKSHSMGAYEAKFMKSDRCGSGPPFCTYCDFRRVNKLFWAYYFLICKMGVMKDINFSIVKWWLVLWGRIEKICKNYLDKQEPGIQRYHCFFFSSQRESWCSKYLCIRDDVSVAFIGKCSYVKNCSATTPFCQNSFKYWSVMWHVVP